MSKWFVAGGAGFIGSHFTDRLLADPATERVTLYDNFSSGREWHYQHHEADARLRVVRGDLNEAAKLAQGRRTLHQVHKMCLDSPLREKSQSLSCSGIFSNTKNLDFHI